MADKCVIKLTDHSIDIVNYFDSSDCLLGEQAKETLGDLVSELKDEQVRRQSLNRSPTLG